MLESENIKKLLDMLCCCGDDHTVREGGGSLNMVQTRYLANWEYLSMWNYMVPVSKEFPLACAIVCDRCIQQENLDIKYVIGGNPGEDGPEYFRVPVDELEKPVVFWPDFHPDVLKGSIEEIS
jgi:hypothetical protein